MRLPSLLSLAATAALLPAAAGAAQVVTLASDTVAVPMVFSGARPVVEVRINGKGPFKFFLDTGAEGSVVDLAFANELGLKLGESSFVGSPGGRPVEAWEVQLDLIEVGGVTIRGATAMAFDRSALYPDSTAPRGVLSPHVLDGALLVLDYPGNRVLVRRGQLPKPDGQEIFGWDSTARLPEIPVDVAGKKAIVHLDSGSGSGLTFPPEFAKDIPLVSEPVEIGRGRMVGQERIIRAAPLKGTVHVGRYKVVNPELRFMDNMVTGGNLGSALLRNFTVTLDPLHRRLRLEHPGGDEVKILDDPRRRRMVAPGGAAPPDSAGGRRMEIRERH